LKPATTRRSFRRVRRIEDQKSLRGLFTTLADHQ